MNKIALWISVSTDEWRLKELSLRLLDFFLFLFSFIVESDEFYRIIKLSMNSGTALFMDIIQDSWIMYIIDG